MNFLGIFGNFAVLLMHAVEQLQAPIFFEEASVSLPVDHFNASDAKAFANRFRFNATFYKPGGPVFFFDLGEVGVNDEILMSVSRPPKSPLMSLAETLNGLAIVWEHRYYGRSMPFSKYSEGTAAEQEEAYRFLNTEQALEDAVFFASHFEPPGLEDSWQGLRLNNTPWIWIGGSYPGQRAAAIRRRNPYIFFASWSSSANLQIRYSWPEGGLHISHDLHDASSRCWEVVQQAAAYVDNILKNGSRQAKVQLRQATARRWSSEKSPQARAKFALQGSDFDVGNNLTGLVAQDWQHTGLEGRMGDTCASFHSARVNFTADSGAALEVVLDAIEANNRYFAEQQPMSPQDMESWTSQMCSEYFNFQTAAPEDPYNIMPTIVTAESFWENTCARRFFWLRQPVDVNSSPPALYTGWDKNFSNVMFTTGLIDPWHQVGMVPIKSFVPGAPTDRRMIEEVPPCNEVLAGDQVFGIVFKKGRHCSDLMPGSKNAQRSVDLFVKALKVWLPSFRPKSGRSERAPLR